MAPMAPLGAIEATPLGVAMRQWLWLYPSIEVVHLVGIALLFGSIAVLGLSREIPVRRLAAHVLPWTIGSFALIVPSGLAMFVAHATDLISNPAFVVKMVVLMLAGTNAAAFHAGVFRTAANWDANVMPPLGARVSAAASLLLWIVVIACGRLLAYL